jgi:hypothetical protein
MTRQELLEQKAALIATIPGKMKANDWHWVQDAASDIREIDAKIEMIDECAQHAKSLAVAPSVSEKGLYERH